MIINALDSEVPLLSLVSVEKDIVFVLNLENCPLDFCKKIGLLAQMFFLRI